MTRRKKKIILVQLSIFLLGFFLLYNTYFKKNIESVEIVEKGTKTDTNANTNNFTDIEYSGFDLSGNRYVLQSKKADFESETPELVNMLGVTANFYLDDGTVLKVISDKGLYNNITLNMDFKENVKATYLTNILLSGQLIYLNSSGKLLASGNVHGESIEKGEFFADNVEYSLANKSLDFSMIGNNQVNVRVKK